MDSQEDQSRAPTGSSALRAYSPAHVDGAEAEQSASWAFFYAKYDGHFYLVTSKFLGKVRARAQERVLSSLAFAHCCHW